jgi:hypothetical protein
VAGGDFAGPVSLFPVWLQPITYRGRVVACATRTRVFLPAKLRSRPAGDPELTFVLFMCFYARDVMSGELAGRYSDDKARAYARAALIPEELLERPLADPRRTARALTVPLDELLHARSTHEAIGRR